MEFKKFQKYLAEIILKNLGLEENIIKYIYALGQRFYSTFDEEFLVEDLILEGIKLSDKKFKDVGNNIIYTIFWEVLTKIFNKYNIDYFGEYVTINIEGTTVRLSGVESLLNDEQFGSKERAEILNELHSWEALI